MILELLEGKSEYTLSEEVMEVKDIYRRTTGVSSGTGNDIDACRRHINTYLLGSTRNGGLIKF